MAAWIFQASPKYFDVENALKKLSVIAWATTRKIGPGPVNYGDKAYIWKAGKDAGIYAVGKVISDEADMSSLATEVSFFVNPADVFGVGPCVLIRIDRRLPAPVKRADLKANPITKDLPIIRMPRATVFAVSDAEEKEIDKLMGS